MDPNTLYWDQHSQSFCIRIYFDPDSDSDHYLLQYLLYMNNDRQFMLYLGGELPLPGAETSRVGAGVVVSAEGGRPTLQK